MRARAIAVCAAAMLLMAGAVRAAVQIETVTVGDAGNAADMRTQSDGTSGYGSVAYTYNIGKYEVTAGQYTAFLNAVAGVDAYSLYRTNMSNTSDGSGITRSGGGTVGNPYTYSVATDFVNRPVNYVNWGDAARFVNWLHNGQPTGAQGPTTTEDGAYYLNGATTDAQLLGIGRKSCAKWAITSEDEWYKAAYYKGGGTSAGYWTYPTSTNAMPGRDMDDASGDNANYDPNGNPYPIDQGKYTTLVGEFQNSVGPYGTFDQGGNVWEWNEATVNGTYHGLRGGSYDNNQGCLLASLRGAGHPALESSYLGFRVAEVPEPATLSLLVLGGLAMLRRRQTGAGCSMT